MFIVWQRRNYFYDDMQGIIQDRCCRVKWPVTCYYFSDLEVTSNRCWSLHLNYPGKNSVSYNGVILWRVFYVKHNTLNSICSCMGNQWSCRRTCWYVHMSLYRLLWCQLHCSMSFACIEVSVVQYHIKWIYCI